MRVIAGSARGRALRAPPTGAIRPTGDKVKGAIFSLLEALAYKRGFEPEGAIDGPSRFAAARAWPAVLDLYAGSGALGIEALSRGAQRAVFVESDSRACNVINHNLRAACLADRAEVRVESVERALSTLPETYDLILADPPYGESDAARNLARLAGLPMVAESSVLVWEHRAEYEPPITLGPLHLARTRRHGIAAISLYTRDPREEERRCREE